MLVALVGCRVRPWELDPVVPSDGGAVSADMPVVLDLAPPLMPCHLTPAGPAVETIKFSGSQSYWRAETLLRRSGTKHVVQAGTVRLRFGGWDDDAIHVREYDVSTWPPTPVAADTELYYSVHSPVVLFEEGQDLIGAVWYTDTDGVGPTGVKYRTIDPKGWTLSPDQFLLPNNRLLSSAVSFPGGDRFAVVTSAYGPPSVTTLSVFARGGAQLQHMELAMPPLSGAYAIERTDNQLLLIAAPAACGGDMGGCSTTSIGVYRISDGTASAPIKLDLAASIPAPIGGVSVAMPILLSDHHTHHMLTWLEYSSQYGTTLYGMALHADGTPAGLPEVWFHTALPMGTTYLTPTVGPMGIVYPLGVFIPTDGGDKREVHLVQRQLVTDEPVTDTTFVTQSTSFGLNTVQIENPRTLILGYSDYYPAPTYGGTGLMMRYVCSEDVP